MPLGHAYHVMPINDLVEHEPKPDCICGPRVEHDEHDDVLDFIFLHHGLDGREQRMTHQ